MAYDAASQAPYSGNNNFLLYVYVRRDQTDAANNRSTYAWEVSARNPNGLSSSYYLDPIGGAINFDPGNPATNVPFSHNLDFRAGQGSIVLASGTTGWFNHDANGNLNVNWAAAHGPSDTFGTAYTSGTLVADRIVPPASPPNAPAAPSLSSITDDKIRASVSPPANNGAGIDAYDFQFSTNSNMSGGTVRNNPGPTLDITGLSAGTRYYIRVRAHNSAGWGAWGATSNATTLDTPSAPTGLSATASSASAIGLTWSAPSDNGGASITSYDVQRAANSSFTSGLVTVSTTSRSYSFAGLSTGTTYYFRVRARNSVGAGDWSTTDSATTWETPSAPTSLSTSSPTTSSITVGYAAPLFNGGTAVTEYQVQRATNSEFTSGVVTITDAGSPTLVSGLTPATIYFFRVRARNAVGYGDWTGATSARTTAAGVNLTSLTSTTTVITATWTDSNGNATTGYDVQQASNSSFTAGVTTKAVSASSTSTTLTGTPAETYYVRVRAKTSAGVGDWSNVRSTTMTPSAPTTPTFTDVSPTQIRAWWTRGANGTSIDGYDLQYSTSSSFTSPTTLALTNLTNRTVTGLTPGTTYYFRVRAKVGTQVSAWSSTGTQATPAAAPPGINVVAAANGRSATATMTPPSNSTVVDSYNVQYRIGTGAATTRTTTTNSVTVTGLTAGTTYEWRAQAVIGTYLSPWSAWEPTAQPNPSTEAGDYFDGSTTDKTHTTYQWTGTVNNSTSQAVGKTPTGWAVAAQTSGGTYALMRDSGGRTQPYCARLVVLSDASAAGMTVGQSTAAGLKTPVGEGGTYYGMIYVRLTARNQRVVAQISWYDAAGTHIQSDVGAVDTLVSTSWVRLTVTAVAPPGAATAVLRVKDVTGAGWSPWLSGDTMLLDDMLLSLTPGTGYFDGSTKDTVDYTYDWTGAANASSSVRSEQADPSNALQDPDCPPAPAPPRPPVITEDCIEDETQWRRYWTAVDRELVESRLDSVPIVRVAASAASRLVRVRYYRNPDDLPLEGLDPASFFAEQVISYIPAGVTYILDGTLQRMWADFGDGTLLPADHLLYGRGGESAAWPVFTGGISHYVTVDVPLDSPDNSITVDFDLVLRYH